MVPLDRQTAQREGLLSLARALVIAHQGGTFSETLEIVTEALGADGGAAYELEQEGLVLVAHRGLTMDLRVALERLPKADEPWFIAARAAKSRRIVVEPDVAASTANADVAKLFAKMLNVAEHGKFIESQMHQFVGLVLQTMRENNRVGRQPRDAR